MDRVESRGAVVGTSLKRAKCERSWWLSRSVSRKVTQSERLETQRDRDTQRVVRNMTCVALPRASNPRPTVPSKGIESVLKSHGHDSVRLNDRKVPSLDTKSETTYSKFNARTQNGETLVGRCPRQSPPTARTTTRRRARQAPRPAKRGVFLPRVPPPSLNLDPKSLFPRF